MRNKFLVIAFFLGLVGAFIVSLNIPKQNTLLESGYTEYDKHKAVITCMQSIYVENYQQMPAEEDSFHLCEQRFLTLSRTLSYEEFIKAKLAPVTLIEGKMQTGNIYYDTMLGYPEQDLLKQ